MASYIDKALIQGERLLYFGHISLWTLAPWIVLGSVLLFAYGAGLVFLLVAFVRFRSTELAVTNKRLIAKFGFFSQRIIELSINKVETIQVHQSVLGRLFDYGSLVVSGAGNPQAPIKGIARPMEFRRAFMQTQDQALHARNVEDAAAP